jgi:hypothetical protein
MQQHHKISETESHELALDSYVMYLHTQTCATCRAAESWSQIYEVWTHPTKTRTSNYRELRPLGGKTLKQDLPIAALARKPMTVPICTICVNHHAPKFGMKVVVSETEWQETLKRKYAAPTAEPRVAKPTTPSGSAKPKQMIPTLDQIKF